MARSRSFSARGRVVVAATAVALGGALAVVLAATDGSRTKAAHAPVSQSSPVAHTTTGGS